MPTWAQTLVCIAVPATIISFWLVARPTRDRYHDEIREAVDIAGQIQRGVTGAFEREAITDTEPADGVPVERIPALCKSATPVPARLPVRGEAYAPSSTSGEDFETGDATTGWKCIKFTTNKPILFQYEYRQGGDYKGPARGGHDPGPNGFEVSAEADLDGDGKKTTLITVTGTLDRSRKSVMRGEETFIANE